MTKRPGLISFFGLCVSLISFSALGSSMKISNASDVENCFGSLAMIDRQREDSGEISRLVSGDEQNKKCYDAAMKFAQEHQSNPETLKAVAQAVQRSVRMETSLKFFELMAKNDKAGQACNDSDLYEAVLAGLGHASDDPSASDSYPKQALAIVSDCLRFASFKTDIVDELKTHKKNVNENLCPYLKSKSIVKGC